MKDTHKLIILALILSIVGLTLHHNVDIEHILKSQQSFNDEIRLFAIISGEFIMMVSIAIFAIALSHRYQSKKSNSEY